MKNDLINAENVKVFSFFGFVLFLYIKKRDQKCPTAAESMLFVFVVAKYNLPLAELPPVYVA